MRQFFILIILLWSIKNVGLAQPVASSPREIDSLKAVLKTQAADSNKVNTIYRLCRAMTTNNVNEAILLSDEGLALARQINYLMGEIKCLEAAAFVHAITGSWEKSSKFCFDGMALSRKYAPAEEVYFMTILCVIYSNLGDDKQALDWAIKAYNHPEYKNSDKLTGQWAALRGLGAQYEKLNVLDSAYYYTQLCLDHTYRYCPQLLGNTLALLSEVLLKQGKFDEAIDAAHKSKEALVSQNYTASAVNLDENIAKIYLKLNKIDSVQKYAEAALPEALKMKLFRTIRSTSKMLSDIYAKKNPTKALELLTISNAANDTLINLQKIKQLNLLEIKEKERVESLQAAVIESKNKLRFNTILGILFTVILISLILYRNNRQKQRINSLLETKNVQIEKEKARAEESEHFKARFLATMSHEIRTPMNAISGMSELLYDTPLDQRQRRYVEGIRTSSDNLLVVINDILDFSKLEAGRMSLENVPFRPTDLLHQIGETLRFRAEEKGLIFTTDITPSVPDVLFGDVARFQLVLLNLAGNALKFTEKGSVTLRIVPFVTDNSKKNTYRFEIADTGIGIAPEQQASIFEQFQQADTSISRRYGGTGLGLTISCQILKLYNAELHLKSEIGVGSTFFFDLILEEPTAETLALVPKLNAFDDYELLKGLRILIAEDNAYNQIVITESLEKWIPDVLLTLTENGHQVLEHLNKNDFDLILMDIQMPELNGYDTTRHIRKDFTDLKKRDIPIIALTASVTQEETHESFDAGMNAVVRKPFRVEDLLREIRQVLGKSLQPSTDESDIPPSVFPALDTPKSDFDAPDFTFLYKFTAGDAEAMQHWKDRFRDNAPLSISQLSAAIADNKADDFCKIAHSFRPQLDMMGLTKPSRLLLEMEENVAQSRDFKEIMPRFSKFQSDIERKIDFLFSIR